MGKRVVQRLTQRETAAIDKAVARFESERHQFELAASTVQSALQENPRLSPFIHFIKFRVKDPEHLRQKLTKKGLEARNAGKRPDINADNLFTSIRDLTGVRILHLCTDQIRKMDPLIRSIFEEQKYDLVEGPVAHCWDDETEKYFRTLGIEVRKRSTMYASVHYVVRSNTKTEFYCELQVRTLAEEVWGEVSHSVNYPCPSSSVACAEQIRVLARICSGTTRLVDSIFRSVKEYEELTTREGNDVNS